MLPHLPASPQHISRLQKLACWLECNRDAETHQVTGNTKIQRISMILYEFPRNQANQNAKCVYTFFQFHPSCQGGGQIGKDGKKSNLFIYFYLIWKELLFWNEQHLLWNMIQLLPRLMFCKLPLQSCYHNFDYHSSLCWKNKAWDFWRVEPSLIQLQKTFFCNTALDWSHTLKACWTYLRLPHEATQAGHCWMKMLILMCSSLTHNPWISCHQVENSQYWKRCPAQIQEHCLWQTQFLAPWNCCHWRINNWR